MKWVNRFKKKEKLQLLVEDMPDVKNTPRRKISITKKQKKIIGVVIGIPIYLYLLTLRQSLTGAILGLTILFLIFYGFYKAVQRKMYREMEVITNVRYPERENTDESFTRGTEKKNSGVGATERKSSKKGRGNRGKRKSEGQSQVQNESTDKSERKYEDDGEHDGNSRNQFEESRETTESNSDSVPPVEPVDD